MRRRLFGWLAAAALGFALPALGETPTLRFAVQQAGTVNWELDTIRHYGLDEANGFKMDVDGVAGGPAAQIAFQGGTADVIVSDWLWVARQRAAGRDYVFIPYSRAVGGLVVPSDSPAQTLADLKGEKIGIAGGPLDKSWLILRAFAEKEYGMDLAAETEQVFGAPPLIFKAAVDGEVAGAVNYWHFLAKMRAAGLRELVSVSDAAESLGLDPDTPLLGYVVKGDLVRDHPELAQGVAAASTAAKQKLASDDQAWERLRDRMGASTEAEFEELKAGFRAGIPGKSTVDPASAEAFFALMAELGGEELVGPVRSLPPGVFLEIGSGS